MTLSRLDFRTEVVHTSLQSILSKTNSPEHHSECCLSLSSELFACLLRCICDITGNGKEGTLILSVGCGTGFLEAALNVHCRNQDLNQITVEGVEVKSAKAVYLPGELMHYVDGTRAICERANAADILLFAYPREGSLVSHYFSHVANHVHTVLWLGPRADWIVQQQLLHNIDKFNGPVVLEDAGLAPYEVAVVYRRNTFVRTSDRNSTGRKNETSPLDFDSI